MTVFDHPDFRGHERVVFVADRSSGLRAIIAIHSTALGAAGGGVRCLPYARPAFALDDALRLARAMTHRAALAGVPLGGAQAVIIADPLVDKTEALLEAFGRAIEALDGVYSGAPDLGMTARDMAVIGRMTGHVIGLPGAEHDLAAAAGYGIFQAIRAAVRARLDRSDLGGLRVAVQGLNQVGMQLCGHLCEAGATLLVADPDPQAVGPAVAVFGARAIPVDRFLACDAEVLAPCATGPLLDAATAGVVRAPVVCGAHLPLIGATLGRTLQARNILVVPDTLASAGLAIGTAAAMLGDGEPVTRRRIEGIFEICLRVLACAERAGITPAEAAARLAGAVIRRRRAPSRPRLERAVA
jgi:leucine dehydrogenase